MTVGIHLIRHLSVKAFSLSGTARWSRLTVHFADPAGRASWFLCRREPSTGRYVRSSWAGCCRLPALSAGGARALRRDPPFVSFFYSHRCWTSVHTDAANSNPVLWGLLFPLFVTGSDSEEPGPQYPESVYLFDSSSRM